MAVLKEGLEDSGSAIVQTTSGGYPVNLSASDRWRALGGSEGAPKQLEAGCRWVGGPERVEIDNALIRQCTENSEAGKVTDLNFHFKFVQQISGLDQLTPNLRNLDLSTNNIRMIEGLAGATKLRELKLYSCQICRIKNLEHCPSLMALHLEDNHISAIEGLDTLRSLEYLNMDSNRIQKLGKGLARLTRLRELHLCRNQLTSLDGLAGLSALETCTVDHNRLCQVTAEQVKGLVKLDELRMSGNQLESLGFLAAGATRSQPSLPSLVQLDASNNRLRAASLRDLPPLPQLAELNLAGNQIEEIEPGFVSSFPSLEILDLVGNLLSKGTEDLAHLKEIASLRELLIQGNPFLSESEPVEVQKALSVLDGLEFLDDKPLERKPEVQTLSLEGGDQDTQTFELTLARGEASPQPEMSTRPTSALGSRPGTSGSRPGTAQKMSEAGVKDPLMHMKAKLSDKRFASEEQVMQWERQTLSSLQAVQRQIDKTSHHIDADLRDMNKFLVKADNVLKREKELNGKRPSAPGNSGDSEVPTLRSATVAHANAALAGENLAAHRDSRVKFRLKAAVERGREEDDEDDVEDDPPPDLPNSLPCSPLSSPSRLSPVAAAAAVSAACDEEIEEDPLAEPSPACSSPEPEEVEEELQTAEVEQESVGPTFSGLGPRAARAMAAATATVTAESKSPKDTERPTLRVDTRARDRGSLMRPVLDSQARASSRDSRGRPGSQGKTAGTPSQESRTRPPAQPVRTSSRGPKR
jgi:hypothetical protein